MTTRIFPSRIGTPLSEGEAEITVGMEVSTKKFDPANRIITVLPALGEVVKIRVRFTNECGETSTWSATRSATAVDTSGPVRNVGYKLIPPTDTSFSKVAVSWDPPSNTGGSPITGYICFGVKRTISPTILFILAGLLALTGVGTLVSGSIIAFGSAGVAFGGLVISAGGTGLAFGSITGGAFFAISSTAIVATGTLLGAGLVTAGTAAALTNLQDTRDSDSIVDTGISLSRERELEVGITKIVIIPLTAVGPGEPFELAV